MKNENVDIKQLGVASKEKNVSTDLDNIKFT